MKSHSKFVILLSTISEAGPPYTYQLAGHILCPKTQCWRQLLDHTGQKQGFQTHGFFCSGLSNRLQLVGQEWIPMYWTSKEPMQSREYVGAQLLLKIQVRAS